MAFQQHSLLAELGIDVFRCNHAVCINIHERVQMGKLLQDKLLEWCVTRVVRQKKSRLNCHHHMKAFRAT